MKGEVYYREKYPKELRIQIENEDELKLLKLIFNDNPSTHLKRYKKDDLIAVDLTENWKKDFSKKADLYKAEEDTTYTTWKVWEAIHEELENMKVLEDASNV